MNDDVDDEDKDKVDFTPLFEAPDPKRLEQLARRITASATHRRPRSVMAQLRAWAPVAVGLSLAVAALAWLPAVMAPPERRPPSAEMMLLQLSLSRPGPRAEQPLWFKP